MYFISIVKLQRYALESWEKKILKKQNKNKYKQTMKVAQHAAYISAVWDTFKQLKQQ